MVRYVFFFFVMVDAPRGIILMRLRDVMVVLERCYSFRLEII